MTVCRRSYFLRGGADSPFADPSDLEGVCGGARNQHPVFGDWDSDGDVDMIVAGHFRERRDDFDPKKYHGVLCYFERFQDNSLDYTLKYVNTMKWTKHGTKHGTKVEALSRTPTRWKLSCTPEIPGDPEGCRQVKSFLAVSLLKRGD